MITVISKELYDKKYWPNIKDSVLQILKNPTRVSFAQEELLRNIYNVCCQRHAITLYSHLLELVEEHLITIYQYLVSCTNNTFVLLLSGYFTNYKFATEVLCIVFRYMDRVYIVEKLKSSLKVVLQSAFNNIVIHKDPIQIQLAQFLNILPSQSDPTIIMNLIKGLYELDKDYASLCPSLFAMYIPCLQPSRGLEFDKEETHKLISHLRIQGYGNGCITNTFKRKYSC